jgi:acyl dehydratase
MTSTSPPVVGQELRAFHRTTDLENWNRFAAVNDEFVPLHMDDAAGRAGGFNGAIGMGNLQWSYLHNILRDWIGANGRILTLDCRFVSPNTRGQVVVAKGVVQRVRPSSTYIEVDLDVWTEDEESGIQIAKGTATVTLARP